MISTTNYKGSLITESIWSANDVGGYRLPEDRHIVEVQIRRYEGAFMPSKRVKSVLAAKQAITKFHNLPY